jgi:hypothetical protein
MTAHDEQTTDRQSTSLGFVARLWWMLFCNVVAAISLISVFSQEGSFFHPADGVLWITVASLALIRYIDIRFCDGQTVTGRRASMTDWIRYAALLIVSAATLWAIAHATNYLFVGRIAVS